MIPLRSTPKGGRERESEREVAAGGRATEAAYMTVLVLTPEPVAALGKVSSTELF